MTPKVHTVQTITCSGCDSTEVQLINIKPEKHIDVLVKEYGWLKQYGVKESAICPNCHKVELIKLSKSDNMYDRINAGVYDNKLHDQFIKDALEYVGLTGHPRADKAMSWAYEHGHSGGLSETLSSLQSAADLLIGD